MCCGGFFLTLCAHLWRKSSNRSADDDNSETRATVPWGLPVTDADLDKLVKGHQPNGNDDQWIVSASEPDERGKVRIRMIRSQSGNEPFRLTVSPTTEKRSFGNQSTVQHEISEITWDRTIHETDAEAKNAAAGICRRLLGCELSIAA